VKSERWVNQVCLVPHLLQNSDPISSSLPHSIQKFLEAATFFASAIFGRLFCLEWINSIRPNHITISVRGLLGNPVPVSLFNYRSWYEHGSMELALKWLERIVRTTLLNFLSTETQAQPGNPRKQVFRTLAKREHLIRLVAAGPIQKAEPLTLDRVTLD
jgi:hypothetical protein